LFEIDPEARVGGPAASIMGAALSRMGNIPLWRLGVVGGSTPTQPPPKDQISNTDEPH